MEAFKIKHSHGITETHETYEAAVEAVKSVYRSASIGHSGDIADGGNRTSCWVDEETATDDDGSRACAVITRVHG